MVVVAAVVVVVVIVVVVVVVVLAVVVVVVVVVVEGICDEMTLIVAPIAQHSWVGHCCLAVRA